MARKTRHNARPRKKSNQAKARIVQPAPVTQKHVEPLSTTNDDIAPVAEAQAPPPRAPRTSRPYQHGKQAPTARLSSSAALSMSKAQEFAFIRNDLRRLLVTAGILVTIMIALLIVIDR